MSDESSVSELNEPAATQKRGWGVITGTIWGALAFLGPRLIADPITQFLTILPIGTNTRTFLLEAIVDVLVFMALLAILQGYSMSLKEIGLGRLKLLHAGWALFILPLYYICSLIAVRIVTLLFPNINPNAQQQIGFTQTRSPELFLIFIALVIVPPVVEEMTFRGFLLRAYHRRIGPITGSVIVSLLFAALHAPFIVCVDVFVLSLFLCYLRIKTDSLWPGIFMHACKNLVAFLYLFIIGGK